MSGIQYPVEIKDIGKFEHQNNVSVNVYGYEDKKIFPLCIINMTIARDHMNLLYIIAGKNISLRIGVKLGKTGIKSM